MDAYLTGPGQARAAGRNLASIRFAASFFISRVDPEVDHRLEVIGTPAAAALEGRPAITAACLAYLADQEAEQRPPLAAPSRAGRAAPAGRVGHPPEPRT